MLRSVVIDIPNFKITYNSSDIIIHIVSVLDIAESDVIRWAITATHGEDSSIIVTYAE